MKRWIGIVTIAAVGLGSVTSANAADYRWLSGWDDNYPAMPYIVTPFIKAVEAASKGSIKIQRSGPETVPAFEQLQPVASGAFHFLFTHGAYHFGTTPMLTAIEAIGGTPESRRASGIFELIDKHYQKMGLKLVSIPMGPDGGYAILLRQPPGPSGDLQGRKIRGTPSYHGVFRMLGASPVQLPPGEIYTSLDKGVVDGAAWPVLGPLNYRWYEVAKYMLRPGFGFTTQPLLMNLAAWNKLSDAERKILLDEGRKMEDLWPVEAAKLFQSEEKALIEKGMTIVQMGEAQKVKLKDAWSEALWEMSLPKAKKDVEELRAFAKSKGL
ncbi:MAG: TRAP transporter substrate-binding protein DctP [Burkholderiales bacterium]